MQIPTIERHPLILDNFLPEDNGNSEQVFGSVLSALLVFEETYGFGSVSQAVFSDEDFLLWLNQHKEAQDNPQYERSRGVGEVALIMGLEGPHQIGFETREQDVLEVGPGFGVFAEYVSKHAQSLTLVGSDQEFLKILPNAENTKTIFSPIQTAELEEGSFDKVFDIFAALTWGADMRSTSLAFYKELNLTKVGGSLFAVPMFARLIQRAHRYLDQGLSGQDITPHHAFRDFRDYTLGRSLIRVMKDGLVLPTFGIDVWDQSEDDGWLENPNRYFDSTWVILDKAADVPSTPPEDILMLGYDLQDGVKISSTIKDEIGISATDLDLVKALDLSGRIAS